MSPARSHAAATPAILFEQALALHRQGKSADAERICDQVLTLRPKHVDALHLLSFIALQTGRPARGVELATRAIQINPQAAPPHRTLGVGLRALRRFDQALASLDRAIALRPDYVEAHHEYGLILAQLQRHAEALACFDRVITLKPDFAGVYLQRGVVLHAVKRYAEALECYDKMIALQPEFGPAHFNRGITLEALRRFDDALDSYDRAIALRPDFAGAYNNRGNVLQKLQRHEEALACYDRAAALDPTFADPHYNRAAIMGEQLRHEDAIALYDMAIARKPDYAYAQWNKGLSLLTLGRFEEGWRQYEWRKRLEVPIANRPYRQPLWLGQAPVIGRTLLIHSEQGLGDTIQFCRYGKLIHALGTKVIMAVPAELVRLLKCLEPDVAVIADTDQPPAFDIHCPMMSLPLALGTKFGDIPTAPRYLRADPALHARWETRLAALTGLKVGLVWAGGIRPEQETLAIDNTRRSLSLASYAPFATVSGVSFISLQKGPPASEARTPPAGMTLHDWTDELVDFADTAGLIEALDLVISVDTAVVHLAGALGKPVWVMNRFDTCWRWFLWRTDSPWYPSVRLFRQPTMGDWTSVIGDATLALQEQAARAAAQ